MAEGKRESIVVLRCGFVGSDNEPCKEEFHSFLRICKDPWYTYTFNEPAGWYIEANTDDSLTVRCPEHRSITG